MDHLLNVMVATDKVYTVPQRAPVLSTWLRLVNPGLYAQQSHSLCLEYLWHIYQDLYQMYY